MSISISQCDEFGRPGEHASLAVLCAKWTPYPSWMERIVTSCTTMALCAGVRSDMYKICDHHWHDPYVLSTMGLTFVVNETLDGVMVIDGAGVKPGRLVLGAKLSIDLDGEVPAARVDCWNFIPGPWIYITERLYCHPAMRRSITEVAYGDIPSTVDTTDHEPSEAQVPA